MAVAVPRAASSPSMPMRMSGRGSQIPAQGPAIQRTASADPSLGLASAGFRPVDAFAIQVMRGATSAEDRQAFILAYQQLLTRRRLVELICGQLTSPTAAYDTLLTFTRDLLRHWRFQSVPGAQLKALVAAASALFNQSDLTHLKLLALAAAQAPPPLPRASPGLGKLPPFGVTFGGPAAKTAEELADWSSLEEYALFTAVRTRELVRQAWQGERKERHAPNVTALVSHFNRLSLFVAAEILGQRDDDKALRVTRVHVAIGVLKRALSLHAYNTAMALFAGLNHGSVQRLKRMWMLVHAEHLKVFTDAEALLSHVGNYARLTQELSAIPPGTTVMPYLGAALKDLALIHLGNRNYLDKRQVNLEKIRLMGRRIQELLRYQGAAYAFTHPWPMSSSSWAQALARADLPSEEELWHLSAMIEPKLYIPATDSAPARPFWQFSPDEVAAYLNASGLGAYSVFFQKHGICGADALSVTDAELSQIGLSDPISRTKVLTALCDVATEHASGHLHHSSSSSSSSGTDLTSLRSFSRQVARTKTLRLKCSCEGEVRVLRFEDGPPLLASYVARQAALMFGIAEREAPTLDERHLRTLLRRNGKLELFRPRTPR